MRALTIRPSEDDPDCCVVGRPEGGEFVELPRVGVDAIRLLGVGLAVGEVEERLAEGADRPDVAGLVEGLIDLAFVASVDGRVLPDPVGTGRFTVPWLRAAHVRWLFTRPVLAGYLVLLGAAVVSVARHPGLLPGYSDFFWTDYVGLATLVNTALFAAGAVVHELLHLAAARAFGLPARIGVGTRLNNLALQTDVSAAWALPRRDRYRIYLAGMAWDVAAVCLALLACQYAVGGVTRDLLAAYVLVATIGIAFQAQVWMRTDLYFVLMDALRCRDLFHDGLGYARYLLVRAARRPAPDPSLVLPQRERRAVRIYAPLVVVGSAAALAAYALFGIPVLVETTARGITALTDLGSGGDVLRAVDGGLVLAVTVALEVAFLLAFHRSHPTWFGRGPHQVRKEVNGDA